MFLCFIDIQIYISIVQAPSPLDGQRKTPVLFILYLSVNISETNDESADKANFFFTKHILKSLKWKHKLLNY